MSDTDNNCLQPAILLQREHCRPGTAVLMCVLHSDYAATSHRCGARNDVEDGASRRRAVLWNQRRDLNAARISSENS